MRIIHLTASAGFGGPERQMLGLAATLPADYTTTFLSFPEGGRCRPFLSTARTSGFDAAELANDTPNLRAAVREVAAVLRGNLADVLVTHGYKSNLLGRPAAWQAGVPIVSVSRGWTGENLKVWCYESLDRFNLRYMDRVVCVSDGQARRVLRAGVPRDRVRVIRNAARLGAFARINPDGERRLRALAGGTSGPVVLAAGRLSPEKGFDVLVEAARRVCRNAPVRFVLCGEGPEHARLQRLISRYHLGDVFHLAGFRHDLDTLIPWASVVAIPSYTEGMPNVALEAGAAGVPVVATAVGGIPEAVVDGRTGYLVPAGNPAALAARIEQILHHPERARAFGTAAQGRMREHFSFEAQARAYDALFTELVSGGRPVREPACG